MVGRLLRRWANPHSPCAAWLRNLFRWRLRLNETSNSARHRLRRSPRQGHAVPRKSRRTHHPLDGRRREPLLVRWSRSARRQVLENRD